MGLIPLWAGSESEQCDVIGPITVALAAYTQAVGDLTVACELGFVAKEEYSLHFWYMS